MSNDYHPLTNLQKGRLCQEAKLAWEASGQAARDRADSIAADPFGLGEKDHALLKAYREKHQFQITGKKSLTQCQQRHYKLILNHWQKIKNGGTPDWPSGKEPGNLYSEDRGPQLQKIGKLLVSRGKPWEYGHEMAERFGGVSCLDWCDSIVLRNIITALIAAQKKAQTK